MKKLFSLILALMMLLCSIPAFAESAGGWTIPEETELTDDAMNSFYSAIGDDAELYPQILMGTQIVAGINYAVLCSGPQGAEIVYVYHGINGEDQLLRKQQLLPIGENMAGGWGGLLDEEASEMAHDAVHRAFDGLTGIGIKEYYILAQQVVAGMNYAVLCRKVTITAEPTEGWVMAKVYVDLEGNASVTDMQDLVLSVSEE